MKPVILLDTGPLVAYLYKTEQNHAWAVAQIKRLEPPLYTCEAVLTEAFYLLRSLPGGLSALIELVERNAVVTPFALTTEFSAVALLMKQYANLPMSLADACLVRMAEIYPESKIITLDRHFKVYRKNARQVIPTLMPD